MYLLQIWWDNFSMFFYFAVHHIVIVNLLLHVHVMRQFLLMVKKGVMHLKVANLWK